MIQPYVRTTLRNAVTYREMRARTRGWLPIAMTCSSMALLGAVALGFLIYRAGRPSGQASVVGIQLFQALAVSQLALILLLTPVAAAGAISGERQRQTWELLLVTRLSMLGIIGGKLVATLAFNLMLILAALPIFAPALLLGQISGDDVLHVAAVYAATVLLVATASLLISALTRRIATSIVISIALTVAVTAGATLLTAYLESWGTQQYSSPQPLILPHLLIPPPLTPLAQIDPLAALASALPGTSGESFLGGLTTVHHAFGLPVTMQLWSVYAILAASASFFILVVTVRVARYAPRRFRRGVA